MSSRMVKSVLTTPPSVTRIATMYGYEQYSFLIIVAIKKAAMVCDRSRSYFIQKRSHSC